jgi:hypothetical protein
VWLKSKRRAKYSVKSHDVKIDVKMGPVGSCVVCLVCDSSVRCYIFALLILIVLQFDFVLDANTVNKKDDP